MYIPQGNSIYGDFWTLNKNVIESIWFSKCFWVPAIHGLMEIAQDSELCLWHYLGAKSQASWALQVLDEMSLSYSNF